ncbi:phytoene desaturase family protein [Tomitella fengzijianii]|uniref:Pyridine nucleotide-disulfide oxidoreductase domain-containing protein 2 n=1 Tax=Tomitella fengzijianii TaxID=2597660 RepID=A0A516X4B0_9ACTN|nr:NAD(P)/FAD-dependent oxidoreductase [Tomitella fengzijianii]QDQ97491.1 NAD(P)/FAD-dependent oxidoreductase [Tomitella fengzijianii]
MESAVVVGSGPNGLSAAVRLARAGLAVTVVEQADVPGGGARSGEATLPGLLHDECSAFHPMGAASPYIAALGLERHGLRWRWPTVDLAHPLDDGRAALAGRDPGLAAQSLGADADRWRRVFAWAHRASLGEGPFDQVMAEALRPLIHVPRHPLVLGRFGAQAVLPATVLSRRFADEPARALFMGAAAHQFGRLDIPFTSAVGMVLAGAAQAVGWPVAEGGSRAITDALVAELESHGGRITTGMRVRSLEQLREVACTPDGAVLFDTAPQGVLAIAGDALPPRVRRALQRFRYGPAAFKVDLAVEGPIPWTNADCGRAGTVHLGGTAAEIADSESATVRGEMPDRPFVLLGQQYVADPSRSRGDANPVYAYAHVPHGYPGDATDAIISQIERFAPGFRERILAVSVAGPCDLEVRNPNYVGGDIGAGANTARQLVFRPRPTARPYSLGAPGLYLCSSATPPGGGVHGMCGFHAAGAALADAGLSDPGLAG